MATEIWVNIGSGNRLLPDGTKPLPEPMLTYHQRHSFEVNFTIDTSAINHWNYLETYLSKIPFKSPRGQWDSLHVDSLHKETLMWQASWHQHDTRADWPDATGHDVSHIPATWLHSHMHDISFPPHAFILKTITTAMECTTKNEANSQIQNISAS